MTTSSSSSSSSSKFQYKQFIPLLVLLLKHSIGETRAFSPSIPVGRPQLDSTGHRRSRHEKYNSISNHNHHNHNNIGITSTVKSNYYMQRNDDSINYSSSLNDKNRNNRKAKKMKKMNINTMISDESSSSSSTLFDTGLSAASISSMDVDVDVDSSNRSTSRSRARTRSTTATATAIDEMKTFLETLSTEVKNTNLDITSVLPERYGKVLGAALLITSNTVGASMMVLPGLASGPGIMISSGLIFGVYLVNLFSGLLLAEVAINQYETSSCDVPSSFKEFADVNLNSNSAGTFIAIISIFVNMCVLSFDFVRGGQLLIENSSNTNAVLAPIFGSITNADIGAIATTEAFSFSTETAEHVASSVAALGLMTLVGTQSSKTLSKIASVCCITLFTCFAGLVLPGLASIHDPIAIFTEAGMTPPGSEGFASSVSTFVPIALMTLVYQNIVPTVTKLLNYDRKDVVQAIIMGSCLPMLMYISFCFTEIGTGGAATALGTGGLFMAGIRMSSLVGSATAGIMSVASELQIFLGGAGSTVSGTSTSAPKEECIADKSTSESKSKQPYTLTSVALSAIPPLLAGIYFSGGEGFVGALSLSGSYGTPILYGIIPALLAFNQRSSMVQTESQTETENEVEPLIAQTGSNKGTGSGGNVKKSFAPFSSVFEINDNTEKQIAPGGILGLTALGAGSVALISNQFISDLSNLLQ